MTVDPLTTQIGGSHYKNYKIQPIEYITANNLPFIEGCVVKYISRWREKGGVQDLEKVKHYVDLLIASEKKSRGRSPSKPPIPPNPGRPGEYWTYLACEGDIPDIGWFRHW